MKIAKKKSNGANANNKAKFPRIENIIEDKRKSNFNKKRKEIANLVTMNRPTIDNTTERYKHIKRKSKSQVVKESKDVQENETVPHDEQFTRKISKKDNSYKLLLAKHIEAFENTEHFGQLAPPRKKKKKLNNANFNSKSSKLDPDENFPSLLYLVNWKNNRMNWSFKKSHQIWLLKNMYNNEVVPNKYFTILLDYLNGLKGNARTKTLNEAKILGCNAADEQDELTKLKLYRADCILQTLSKH